jgi:hypothetical protein
LDLLARYLAIHTPVDPDDPSIHKPTDMVGLAREAGGEDARPRWLRTWSPDLHDDRIFTLWDADDAAQIQNALQRFGFLDHMSVLALRVQEWGPTEVLAAEADERS